MKLLLDKDLQISWQGKDPFDEVKTLRGEIYREKEGRRTLRFELSGKTYFLKLHQGIGWLEVIKNLIQLRLPVVGATNEWNAIQRLHDIGLHTMTAVGYGRRGISPASQLSFLITRELKNTLSLENLCERWIASPPNFRFKQAVIRQLAEISQCLHHNGINHRDYYLCHFLADISMGADKLDADNLKLYVVDLHRAQLRFKTPLRWIIKDLGGLYFSAMNTRLTSRDVLRFMSIYSGKPVTDLKEDANFWCDVKARGRKIQIRYRGVEPHFPL